VHLRIAAMENAERDRDRERRLARDDNPLSPTEKANKVWEGMR
jgi:hypothetical protein